MIENLDHNRERARSAPKSKTHGFTYAIKPDGSLLGDELYEKRRQRKQPFPFLSSHEIASFPRGPLHHRPENCLASIDRLVKESSSQYRQVSSMPPEPAEPLSDTPPSSHAQPMQFPSSSNAVVPSSSNPPITSNTAAFNNVPTTSYSNDVFNTAQSFAPMQTRKENVHPNPSNSNSNFIKGPDLDDDYDTLLADIDVDQVVSQRLSLTNSTHNSNTGMNSSGNDYNTNINPSSRNHGNLANSSANFDYGRWDNTNANGNTSFSNDAHMGGGSSSNGAPTFDNDSGGHNNDSYGTHSNNYSEPSSSNNNDTPPCPGHNMPCRLLMANTASNMGRQFYKCSMPEGQACDFFEWADGMEGNMNNDLDNGGGSIVSGSKKDMYTENQRIFGHRSFRLGQKEVIQQAISGRDVFVLMPTGGGKSLCYQLPAWCCPGVAIIVSPLLSLIQDQVQSMTKVGVRSVFLNSKQDYETEQKDILQELEHNTPAHGGIKLLYLTPEKLTHSTSMKRILRKLYERGLLSRIVVDEAHCLSDWGHDFRPDYNQLGKLRREFPNTPLMALTATANEKVVNDAIRALGMRNEYTYRSSFNRKNLHYEVRKKDGKVVDAIADHIATKPRESGVVYCLSRKNCEDVAKKLQGKLREKGCGHIRVSFYHAQVEQTERDRRHHAWSIGKISVLCATIAFGMGIDKPDVRYVIHYSMPKSITHYYQESGRAGRDGEQADCILFYSYKDKKTLESMLRKGSPNSASTRRKIDQLYTCVRYCENEFRCRRTMQLEFFGENFDRSKCNGTCDNCKAGKEPERRDTTGVARTLLGLLTDFQNKRNGRGVTLVQVSELYRGAKTKSLIGNLDTGRLKGYGAGSKFKKYDIDRIMHAMVFERLLVEESTETNGGFAVDYVQYGENAHTLLNGGRQFFVEFPKAQPARKAKAKITKSASKKSSKRKPASKASTGKRKSTGSAETPSAENGLQFQEAGDSSDDDILSSSPFSAFSANKVDLQMVLSHEQTKQLSEKIKKMTQIWALEEQEMGNNVHYWNILSVGKIKSVAHFVPTSLEELSALGVLGEAKLKEYGERMVKIVISCLENELGLDVDFVKRKRPVKRAKVPAKDTSGVPAGAQKRTSPDIIMIDDNDDEFDEFDTAIDFSAIEIPSHSAVSSAKNKSRHFG